jgi:hypothetical protein
VEVQPENEGVVEGASRGDSNSRSLKSVKIEEVTVVQGEIEVSGSEGGVDGADRDGGSSMGT